MQLGVVMIKAAAKDWRNWVIAVLVGILGYFTKAQLNDFHEVQQKLDSVVFLLQEKDNRTSVERINQWAAWTYQINVNQLVFKKLEIPRELWPSPPYWMTSMGPADSTHWR